MNEAELLAGVLDLLRLYGFRVAHFRPARTAHGWRTPVAGDAKGWPDVFAVRVPGSRLGRLIAAELKVGNARPTPEQAAWLADLEAAGVEVFVWTDRDYPDRISEALL